MLKHALFTAPKGMLSTFSSVILVDYGSNVPEGEPRDFKFWSPTEVEEYPPCDPNQFMARLHLPAVESLAIWLRSSRDVITREGQGNLRHLHTLGLVRATIEKERVPELLYKTPGLRTLNLGMAYKWKGGGTITRVHREPILNGLMSVRGTVEKLSLGCEYYPEDCGQYSWSYANEDETSELFVGSLKKFNRLRSVEVPIYMLFQHHTNIKDSKRLLGNIE